MCFSTNYAGPFLISLSGNNNLRQTHTISIEKFVQNILLAWLFFNFAGPNQVEVTLNSIMKWSMIYQFKE